MNYGAKHKRLKLQKDKDRAFKLYNKSARDIALCFFIFVLKLDVVTSIAAGDAWDSFKARYDLHD